MGGGVDPVGTKSQLNPKQLSEGSPLIALDEADDFLLHCNDLRKLQHCTFFGETIMMSCHGKTPPIWAELSVMSDQTQTELNGIVENDVCEHAGSLLSPLCPRVTESRPYVITLASCRSNVHHECPHNVKESV